MTPSPIELPLSAPSGGEPRERADARRNRERILCAVARLIEREGIDAVSMDGVAAEAGVGKGTLYRRFGDRAALLRTLISEPEAEFQERIIRGEPPLGPGAPPCERLHAFGDGLLDHLERHAPLLCAADKVAETSKRFSHPVYLMYRSHVALLLRQLRGESPATEYLADALMAPLAPDAFVFQRQARGMTIDEVRDGWHALAEAVANVDL